MFIKNGFFIVKLFTLILFVAVSGITLFFAYGYQFEFDNRNIDVKKTSIIDINVHIDDLDIFFDGVRLEQKKLPYQIKNVSFGDHTISLKKKGFFSWFKKIHVKEDVVTIVQDIFLVPDNIHEIIKIFLVFTSEEYFYFDNTFLLAFNPTTKFFRYITFSSFPFQEKLFFFPQDVEKIIDIHNDNFLFQLRNKKFALVNFVKKKFTFFDLPSDAHNIRLFSESPEIYFIQKNALYRFHTDFSSQESPLLKIISNLQSYKFGFSSELYFLSSGLFFRTDIRNLQTYFLNNIHSFNKKFTDLNVKFSKHYRAFLLQDIYGDKSLYFCIQNCKKTILLEKNLKGDVFFNEFEQLLYANQQGEIYYYDPVQQRSIFIEKRPGKFFLIGWFLTDGHFLLQEKQSLILRAIAHQNNFTLLKNIQNPHFFILNKNLFYLEKQKLYLLGLPTH